MKSIDKILSLKSSIDFCGTTTEATMVWDSLLSFQHKISLSGNFLDMGVAQGFSSLIMVMHLESSEKLHMLDLGIGNRLEGAMKIVAENAQYPDNLRPHKQSTIDFHREITNDMKKIISMDTY